MSVFVLSRASAVEERKRLIGSRGDGRSDGCNFFVRYASARTMTNRTNYSSQLLVSSETIVTGCATSKWLCATREATVHQATEHPETTLEPRLLILPEEHLRHVPLHSSLPNPRYHVRRPGK